MEETKFKPKITADIVTIGLILLVIYIIIGSVVSVVVISEGILAVIGVLMIIGFIFTGIFLFAILSIILSKIFLTYYITKNNEIVIEYSFLQKSTKVYRIDQITTLTFKQNFIEKKLGVGTISFDIFGLSPSSQADAQQGGNTPILPRLSTISEYKKVYDMISKQLNISSQKPIIERKPKTSLPKTVGVIFLGILFIVGVVLMNMNISYWPISFLVMIPYGIYLLIGIKRLHRTTYTITQNYAMISHNYFLTTMIQKIPISKITNLKNSKNVFIYSLFGTGTTYLYTGGLTNPTFSLLEDFSGFSHYLSSLTKGEQVSAQNTSQSVSSKKETPLFEKKTHVIYFIKAVILTTIVFSIIFGIFSIVAFILSFSFIWGLLIGVVYIVSIFLSFLYWRSLTYEFYKHKIVKQSGIFTTISEELQFKNLKYISLKRGAIFDKIIGTGTIYLYTAGTASVDKSLLHIKNYDEVYREFEQLLKS